MKARAAITLAAHVAARTSVLPILQHVRIANGHITACDMEQQIEIPIDLPKALGDICVHGARLTRILKSLPEEAELTFKTTKGRLLLQAGPTRFELNTLAAEDFPHLDVPPEDAVNIQIPAEPLAKALAFCRGAMAVADVRYYLNGLHLAIAPGRLVLSATDGHRVHRTAIEVHKEKKWSPREAIIPTACVARIIELAAEHEDIDFTFATTLLLIDTGRESLSTKLIEGKFPDIERVIPSDRPATGAIARAAFSEAVKRVAQVFAGDKLHTVTLDIHPDHIELDTKNSEGELGAERFEWTAADKKFKGIRFGHNCDHLTTALDAFTGDQVFLHLPENVEESLYITDSGEGKREAVVMPMRV